MSSTIFNIFLESGKLDLKLFYAKQFVAVLIRKTLHFPLHFFPREALSNLHLKFNQSLRKFGALTVFLCATSFSVLFICNSYTAK